MADNFEVYGEVVLPVEDVPSKHVDRMYGFRVGRVDGKPAGIDLHFQVEGKPQRMTISLGDAMFLLSTLKSFQLNEDLPFPEDPRDPTWKASDYKSKKGA